MDFNSGPIDPSILFDQINHVTDDAWNNVERNALATIESGSKLVRWNLNEEQIEQCRFHVFTYPSIILKSDACLVSTLVERWSETNTFHFNCGEMTITLEDIGLILGLPVIGRPITCGLLTHPKYLFLKHFGQYWGGF